MKLKLGDDLMRALLSNPPAFPVRIPTGPSGQEFYAHGMSLRDYFAAGSLVGVVSNSDYHLNTKDLSELAYKMADAMMEARKVKDGE